MGKMNAKVIVTIAISTAIAIASICYLIIRHNTRVLDVISILELPITEDQILKKESWVQSEYSVTLILTIDHVIYPKKGSLVDIDRYEGTRLHDTFTTLIRENGMRVEDSEIRSYAITHSIKTGLFFYVEAPQRIYIITGKSNITLVYTHIPNGIVLPREYRPLQS